MCDTHGGGGKGLLSGSLSGPGFRGSAQRGGNSILSVRQG